ncbi:MAG: RlpA-like double-psi beta-barrel domain-containing protein [Solirubrobacteraceae bacterium]
MATASSPAATAPVRHGDPQVVEPTAGQAAAARTSTVSPQSTAGPRRPSLSQPATVTRAPAKGAPSDAQVRAAVGRLQAVTARYHLDQLDFSGSLLNPADFSSTRWNVSIASFYDDYGQGIACGGVLHPQTLGVANKTLPCGTEVVFRYGDRVIRVPVIDRGPYIAGREWDLTGAAAVALHFPGLGPIQWQIAP